MGEETSFADAIRLVSREDISPSGLAQRSVVEMAESVAEVISGTLAAREQLEQLGLSPCTRILFTGPVGTDFEDFVLSVCREMSLNLVRLRVERTLQYEREFDTLVAAALDTARREAPALLHISSLHLLRAVGERSEVLLREQLAQSSMDSQSLVVIVGTTHRPQDLDPQTLLAFDRVLCVGPPDGEDRQSLLVQALASHEDIDIPRLVDLTDGWSYASLRHLVAAVLAEGGESGEAPSIDRIEKMIEEGLFVPVLATGSTTELEKRLVGGGRGITHVIEEVYPDDLLDQLYLMVVTEDYGTAQQVIEALNEGLPLSDEQVRFLNRFPFLLSGEPRERLARLIRAKKNRDRLMRVMGREE